MRAVCYLGLREDSSGAFWRTAPSKARLFIPKQPTLPTFYALSFIRAFAWALTIRLRQWGCSVYCVSGERVRFGGTFGWLVNFYLWGFVMKNVMRVAGLVGLSLYALGAAAKLDVPTDIPNAVGQSARIADSRLDGLSLPFVANSGQTDARVSFYAQTFAGPVYVTHEGELVYSFPPKEGERGWSLVERFEQGKAQPAGVDSTVSRVSYIKDDHGKAVTQSAATFGGVALGEVFPGIRVELHAHGKNVEKIYTLAPGADPARIRMGVTGTEGLSLDKEGNLIAATGNGPVKFTAPVGWQEKDGQKLPVKVSYALDGNQYGYALGEYDRGLPVVIDPLLQATYLGGNGTETADGIAVHPITGDVYVIGHTQHPGAGFNNSFPGTAGGWQASQKYVANSVFIARMTADLKALTQATYFDATVGRSSFSNLQIHIHPINGDIYIVGQSWAPEDPINAVPGLLGGAFTLSDLTVFGVNPYAAWFASRFSSDLTKLKQSTHLASANDLYWGGSYIYSSAINTVNGDICFAGNTNGNGADVLVICVAQDLKTYFHKKVFGGSNDDYGIGIKIHPATGDVYIAGLAGFNDFPGTEGGFQPQNASQPSTGFQPDGFISYLSADLTTIKQSTYLGGVLKDYGQDLLFDANGSNVFIRGLTGSKDFPKLASGARSQPPVNESTFIALMSSDLKQLFQSTIAVYGDASTVRFFRNPLTGDLLAVGSFTPDNNKTRGNPAALRFSPDLKHFYDGISINSDSNNPWVTSAISPASGDLYVVGNQQSSSSGLYPMTNGGYEPTPQTTTGGNPDIYIARYTTNDISGPDSSPDPFSFAPKTGVPLSSAITSSSITITGINVPVTISVSGGSYSIGCTGNFVQSNGTIQNGQTVCVQQTSSSIFNVLTNTTLTVGDQSAEFYTTTLKNSNAGGGGNNGGGTQTDTTPNPFSFKTKKNVKLKSVVTSNTVKITGINAPAPISALYASYSIGCKKSGFTTAPGTIQNNQTVCLRHISLSTRKTKGTSYLTIGGVTGSFSSITK